VANKPFLSAVFSLTTSGIVYYIIDSAALQPHSLCTRHTAPAGFLLIAARQVGLTASLFQRQPVHSRDILEMAGTLRKINQTMGEAMDVLHNTEPLPNRSLCDSCAGYCCYWLPGSILFVTAIDINRIARYFRMSDGEVRRRFILQRNTFKVKVDDSCIFLLDGQPSRRCLIHSARPQQCRDFPYTDPCPYLVREDLLQALRQKM